MINPQKEKEVLAHLFNRYKIILNNSCFPKYIKSIPVKCEKEHLLRLVNEAINNISVYPHDKLYRWLGFTRSVINMTCANEIIKKERPAAFIVQYECNKSVLKESFNYEKKILESEFIFQKELEWPLTENKESLIKYIEDIGNKESIDFTPHEVLHFHLGLIQGILCVAGLIDVDKERDYTRPLLHSFHDKKPKSF